MGLPHLHAAAAVFKFAVWIFLFRQGLRLQLFKRYPLEYVFFVISPLLLALKLGATYSLGVEAASYAWIFFGSNIPFHLLSLLILFRIYYLPSPPRLAWDLPLIATLPLFTWAALAEPMHWGYRVSYVVFFFQAVLGLMATARLWHFKTVKLGSNLGGLLFGLSMPAVVQSINQGLAYVSGTVWSYNAFAIVSELTSVALWGMIAYGMRRYDPPIIERVPKILKPEEAESRLDRLTQALRRWP